ncbi:hypothetical protein, partial [Streptomyces mirabilis]
TGPDGSHVNDQFSFLHRDLGENGSITVRMTSMTGTITYPPPDHDRIVPGLVPWAKAGIIIKDGIRRGSSYAALMLTGSHGVRMQYDYRHDIAGSPGGVSAQSPRWLRLTRSGDAVTGYESDDGRRWTKVGTAQLSGLPRTVQVGLFATSPGDLTLRPVGLGGATEQVRFTQAGGSFDNVLLSGAPSSAKGWRSDTIGEMNRTDWEKYHKASGAVVDGDTITVTGIGDIGPGGTEGGDRPVERTLGGLTPGLLIVLVVAVRFVASGSCRDPARGTPVTRRGLAAKAAVVGAVTFVTGLLAVGVVLPVGTAIQRVLLRRVRLAVLAAVLAIVVPYAVTSVPLLADGLSQWLLRVTPAAGFATQQTLVEYPQLTAHFVPSTGYFPLPWWAGIAVLCAYVVVFLGLALRRLPRSDGRTGQPGRWR